MISSQQNITIIATENCPTKITNYQPTQSSVKSITEQLVCISAIESESETALRAMKIKQETTEQLRAA